MPAALPATPSLGQPVPDVPHAVSVQLPTWNDIKEMFTGAARVKQVQQTGYPRSFIHEDIKQVCTIQISYKSDAKESRIVEPAMCGEVCATLRGVLHFCRPAICN